MSVGEDATRVISRVDYDVETNRLVGFVLPCDRDGLPNVDSFLAISFEAIKEAFDNGEVAKYAFVHGPKYICKCSAILSMLLWYK